MRKTYNIFILIGVITIMMSACKKDQETTKLNTGDEVTWTAEDLQIQNNILNFQSKIKNNSFKDGETITADSAIWYLEALLNFNYSNPDSSFVNLTVDTTFEFQLPVNNDMVNFSNVSNAAFAMEEHILNYLNNMPNSIKFLIAADVKFKANELKDGSKTITITTGYGSGYIDNPAAYTPFGENDYWWYGSNGGGCESNNSNSSDAAIEIEDKINNPNCILDPYPPHYIVNVGVGTVSGDEYRNDDDPSYPYYDNWLDYMMYCESEWDNLLQLDGCLEPIEMNFHLQGTLDVIDLIIAEKQISHPNDDIVFVYLSLEGHHIMSSVVGDSYLHVGEITYGKRVLRVDPTE